MTKYKLTWVLHFGHGRMRIEVTHDLAFSWDEINERVAGQVRDSVVPVSTVTIEEA